MKIAVISDIHGNHYALKVVLNSAKTLGVNKLLVLGDIVGYYYHPDIVINMISEWPNEMIKGNHEVILQKLYEGECDSKNLGKKYGSGHEYALKKLNNTHLNWLFSLPVQKSIIIDNISIQMNHGSPWNYEQYLYPNTNKAILEKCNSKNHKYVLIGHSHYAFSYQCSYSTLINCGSVGQSRQKGGIANWALINTDNESFELMFTPYDISSLLKEIKQIDTNLQYSYKILKR